MYWKYMEKIYNNNNKWSSGKNICGQQQSSAVFRFFSTYKVVVFVGFLPTKKKTQLACDVTDYVTNINRGSQPKIIRCQPD